MRRITLGKLIMAFALLGMISIFFLMYTESLAHSRLNKELASLQPSDIGSLQSSVPSPPPTANKPPGEGQQAVSTLPGKNATDVSDNRRVYYSDGCSVATALEQKNTSFKVERYLHGITMIEPPHTENNGWVPEDSLVVPLSDRQDLEVDIGAPAPEMATHYVQTLWKDTIFGLRENQETGVFMTCLSPEESAVTRISYCKSGDVLPCFLDITFGIHSRAHGLQDDIHRWAEKNVADTNQATAATFHFHRQVEFMGLSMRGAGLKLSPTSFIHMKNLDINHYRLEEGLGLYGSIPLVYAIDKETPQNKTIGIFWLNAAPLEIKTQADFTGTTISFLASEGGVKVFILPGPTPAEVLNQYYYLTGFPAMPPLFALGYHQSRWSYRDQHDVLSVSETFDKLQIPCDTIWLDIDHTDDKKYFTWDHDKFPKPEEMQNILWRRSGRRMVTITDPHIKDAPDYFVFEEAQEKKLFVLQSDGKTIFTGHCWPGLSSWVDFMNPDAREWYSSLFDYSRYKGSTEHLFSWIDMNEPSVFSGPDLTLPMNTIHFDGTRHGAMHNTYGFYHAMATYEGHLKRSENVARPFVLTRSFFAGSQRFAAVWSGDNQAKWSHLQASVIHMLQSSMSGMPFVGADVGGFFNEPEPQLAKRWYQLGVLYPFFRGHSHEQTQRREPWKFPQSEAQKIKEAIRFRYVLLPYIYTTFRRVCSGDGGSIVRPLMFDFPFDRDAFGVTHTFMFGPDILARPIVERSNREFSSFEVHAPDRVRFYNYWTGLRLRKGQKNFALRDQPQRDNDNIVEVEETENTIVPMFLREGSIIPIKSDVGRSSVDLPKLPYRLLVSLDGSSAAEGELYLDDTSTMAFMNKGEYCLLKFSFGKDQLTVKADAKTCTYRGADHEVLESIWIFNTTAVSYAQASISLVDYNGNAPTISVAETHYAVRVVDFSVPIVPVLGDKPTASFSVKFKT